MKILWVGPLVNPEDVVKYKAVSPAGNKWQTSFINALKEQGISVTNFSYLPEPYFPKGQMIPNYRTTNTLVETISSKYINFPFIRNFSLARELKKKLTKDSKLEYIITYNNSSPHVQLGKYAQKHHKKWINIVADDIYSDGPDLTVFLSYGYFLQVNLKNKIHIDGGIESLKFPINNRSYRTSPKIILYAGIINKRNGIEKFALSFNKLNLKDIELHIYGKGNSNLIRKLSLINARIKLHGYVSKLELEKAMSKCTAFINPKLLKIQGRESDFPSKILEYLKFGKPVISSKQIGIAPYYNDFLTYYDPDNIQSLEDAISLCLNLNNEDAKNFRERLQEFQKEHSWNSLAKKLCDTLVEL